MRALVYTRCILTAEAHCYTQWSLVREIGYMIIISIFFYYFSNKRVFTVAPTMSWVRSENGKPAQTWSV